MNTTVEEYLAWLARSRYSPSTKGGYSRDVRAYASWLEAAGAQYAGALRDDDVRDYAVRDYRRWLLTERKQGPATVERAMSALVSLYEWAGLGPPRVPRQATPARRAPQALTVEQAGWVLRAAARRGVRDEAIVMLAMYAGPRVSELVALDVDDVAVFERSGRMSIRAGKGDRPREVPLNTQVRTVLRGWLVERRTWPGSDTPALFLSRQGRRLAVRTVQKMIEQVGRDAGVPNLHPHRLRHTMGRRWVETGGDLVSLQGLMGHSSPTTTAHYARPDQKYLDAGVEKLTVEV